MESKSVKKSRRKYDAEFKKEVIQMIEMGRSVPDIAQSLGIGANLIYQWLTRASKKGSVNPSETDVVF